MLIRSKVENFKSFSELTELVMISSSKIRRKEEHVKQAVVVPKYNSQHTVSMLIAYVVPQENDFKNNLELTAAIKKNLGQDMMAYMIPQKIVYQKSLPLSSNGKVDIKAVIAEVNSQ